MPAQETLNPSAAVASYPVVERHRFVWVWLGNPAAADPDPDLVPDLHWNSDPRWAGDGESITVDVGVAPTGTGSPEGDRSAGVNGCVLDYAGRSRDHMAFVDDLEREHPGRIRVVEDRHGTVVDPDEVVASVPGLSFGVPVGTSLLDALESAGVEMMYDCRRGECGLCRVSILAVDGRVDHRDVFLSERQHAESRAMCACVCRIAGASVTIDC